MLGILAVHGCLLLTSTIVSERRNGPGAGEEARGRFRRAAFDDPLEDMTARLDSVERMLNRLSEEWQSGGVR